MKILLGASGKLGSSLIKYADKAYSRKRGKNYYSCDYSSKCLEKILKDAKEIAIALGSTKTYDKKELWESNVEIVERIVEQSGDAKIILASSIAVYGKNLKEVVNEKTKTNPDSEYARSKLEAEKIVKKKRHLILRIGTLYGKQFLDYCYVIKKIKQKKMVIIGDGENNIPFTHVEDVAKCFFNDKQGVYVVAGKGGKQKQILNEVAKLLNVEPPRKKIPYWLAYGYGFLNEIIGGKLTREHIEVLAKDRRFDSSKAKKELGFIDRDIKKGLEEMVKFCIKNK